MCVCRQCDIRSTEALTNKAAFERLQLKITQRLFAKNAVTKTCLLKIVYPLLLGYCTTYYLLHLFPTKPFTSLTVKTIQTLFILLGTSVVIRVPIKILNYIVTRLNLTLTPIHILLALKYLA